MATEFPYMRVLVTGGHGFLGKAIVRALQKRGVNYIFPLSSADADLRYQEQAHTIVERYKPECIIHCAVQGGGIGWMKEHPVDAGVDNVRINLNVLEAAQKNGVQCVIGVSSACVYPKHGSIPYCEDAVWEGYPEPLNGSYALSKRIMMDLGRAYREQYDLHTVFPVLANLYGPGDHTDAERAHVVADLMIRCAQDPENLVVWGTGIARREFLFVDDAAEGILACVHAPKGEIVNIGTGIETPILELSERIISAHGLQCPIVLDESKPDGQIRKVLDVQKAQELLGWKAQISLEEGLVMTARWYRDVFSVHRILHKMKHKSLHELMTDAQFEKFKILLQDETEEGVQSCMSMLLRFGEECLGLVLQVHHNKHLTLREDVGIKHGLLWMQEILAVVTNPESIWKSIYDMGVFDVLERYVLGHVD